MSQVETCDLAIVGGGPAGCAAAIAASSWQLTACLIDEQPRLGGQIYRQPPREFRVDPWLSGRSHQAGKELLARAEGLVNLRHFPTSTVWGLFPRRSGGLRVEFHNAEGSGRIDAKHVLLATGCYEFPVPFPGWHLPGVMSAGAIQTLLKSQRVAPGRHIVLAGSHPLLLIVAAQLLAAGVRVAAIAFAQPLSTLRHLLESPGTVLGGAGALIEALRALVNLRSRGVPIFFGSVVAESLGDDAVNAVRLRNCANRSDTIVKCDALGICHGFHASSELARQLGARHRWIDGSGWVVDADEFMRSSIPGLSVAGEQIGVAGAAAAALSGEIAGIGVALDAGRLRDSLARRKTRKSRKRLARLHRFAELLASLSGRVPPTLPTEDANRHTVLCRCEDISVGEVIAALRADPNITDVNTIKLATRVGMGMCQGRMCEFSVRRLVAAQRNCPIAEVRGYTARAPVKPIPVSVLACAGDAIQPGHPASVRAAPPIRSDRQPL